MKRRLAKVTVIGAIILIVLGFGTISSSIAAFADDTRMIFITSRSSAVQKNLANELLDSGDLVVFHYGAGRDPTETELTNLKEVSRVPNSEKGLEFFSLAEIQEHAQTVADNGLGFIAYDLEGGASPSAEVSNPVAAFQAAREAADEAGIDLMAVPSNAITNGQYADDIARLVDRYHLQSQPRQDDDTSCNTMRNWVTGRLSVLENANTDLRGDITYQVTLSGNAASGKTVYQTGRDCIDRTSPTGIDGNSIWWNGASFDNGDYRRLLEYHERRYS